MLVIGRCAAPPYPAAPDFPPSGGQNKPPRDDLLINPPLEMTVLTDTPIVISTAAKRSGEIPPLMVQAALRREISRLSVSSERFPPVPIPACGSARDDDPGGQHWRRLRCEGSEGSKGGAIALSGDEFYRPPGEADPFHHWRGPPPPASRGRQVYRGAALSRPTGKRVT